MQSNLNRKVAIMRRSILAVIAAIALFLGITPPPAFGATAVYDTGTITGKVYETYLKYGGEAKLGKPVGVEKKATVQGRNIYWQETTGIAAPVTYTVYWDGSQGGKVWASGKVPSLSSVSRERDAMASSGNKGGVIWRSGKWCDSAASADRLLTAFMNGSGLMLDLRTAGTAAGCPDPILPGVTRVLNPVASHADYDKYVLGSAERAAFGSAIRKIAAHPGRVLLHCSAGKDRTGWTISMILFALGESRQTVKAEYMLSADVVASDFDLGMRTIESKYGTVYNYLRDGLGLDQGVFDALNDKLKG